MGSNGRGNDREAGKRCSVSYSVQFDEGTTGTGNPFSTPAIRHRINVLTGTLRKAPKWYIL